MAKIYRLAICLTAGGLLTWNAAAEVLAEDAKPLPTVQIDLFDETDPDDPFGPAEPDDKEEERATESSSKDDDEGSTATPEATIKPRYIRLHLKDGSVIAGELSSPDISVTTEFGPLKIPVDKIVRFQPGLNSYPNLATKIDELFEGLGADEFRAREQSYKELVAYGNKIQNLLVRYENDSNLERKNRVDQIRKELDESDTKDDEFDSDLADRPWQRDDFITTTKFTVVGKIVEESFQVDSKYGELTVKLSDVQHAERPQSGRGIVKKSLEVSGANLVQRVWKSTGVRVSKGDEIVVRADGEIMMTPWGNNMQSKPDGGAQFGWYVQNEIAGGTLCARIGEQGQAIKVGGRATFVAKRSGTLQFGVAMVHNYAQANYNFPGHYDVQVKVRPK